MSFSKGRAIVEAMRKSQEEQRPFVVIHEPKTYIEVFEGDGFIVLDSESFLSVYGEESIGRIIYQTNNNNGRDVSYA